MKKNSNNGLCTSAWGSPAWFFLHCVAAGYPVDPDEYDDIRGNARGHTRRNYSSFFKNTGHVLPCRFCRESYMTYITELPIEEFLHSRQKLAEWLFLIHNKVNEKIGVKQETSLQTVVDKYERFRAKCHDSKSIGCTEPANKNVSVKCTIVFKNKRRRMILFAIAFAMVAYISGNILKRMN